MGLVRSSSCVPVDPTSIALLLSGPAALDLWPGMRRVHDSPGRYDMLGPVGDASARRLRVQADAPLRTAIATVTRFRVAGPGLPEAVGELRVRGAVTDGRPGACVDLWLASTEWDSALDEHMQTAADGFLANLVGAVRQPARVSV